MSHLLPAFVTPRLRVRPFTDRDLPLLQYRRENRAHLAPWEPERDESYYGARACGEHIAGAQANAQADRGYALAVFDAGETELIATLSLSNVVRGVFQACHLGYGIAARHQGRGLMREALAVSLDWAFGELAMHRVMANYLPRNLRSGKLLTALGFEVEGYARHYLRIAGRWEDHVLTAKLAPQGTAD